MMWCHPGEILATTQTHHAPNTCAAVSPCGKFVACAGELIWFYWWLTMNMSLNLSVCVCSGFTPDVKLWEVEFSKGGDFQQVMFSNSFCKV